MRFVTSMSTLHAFIFAFSIGSSIDAAAAGASSPQKRTLIDSGGTCYARHADANDPSSLAYYHALYKYLESNNFDASERVGSVEAVQAGTLSDDASVAGPNTNLSLMRIASIMGFSASTANDDGENFLASNGDGKKLHGDAAGLLLGIHHFNNGDGSVVREVAGINETCPIRFVVDFVDTESSPLVAVERFNQEVTSDSGRQPSAVIGARRSAVSVPLGTLSSVYQIPQISPSSTSSRLDDTTQFPYFSRLIPSDASTAKAAIASFRRQSPSLQHLGVLYVNDAYGGSFHKDLKESANHYQISVSGSPFSYSDAFANPDDIKMAIKNLADTQYRVFFGVFYEVHYELVMETAFEYGIAGPGYVWILADGIADSFLQGRSYPEDSPLAIATQGVGILRAGGGSQTTESATGYDRFLKAWHDQSPDAVNFYNCVGHPSTNSVNDVSMYYQADPWVFADRDYIPTAGAVFSYDSVMSLGLAACGLIKQEEKDIDGSNLISAFLEQRFEGASGHVSINPSTHSREPSSGFFILLNSVGKTEDGLTTFLTEMVSHTVSQVTSGVEEEEVAISWADVKGKTFRYSDRTAIFPSPLPPVKNMNSNYLTPGLRAVGWLLCFIAVALSIGFAGWTERKKKKRIIQASQPIFLYIICAGSAITAASIIPLSVDKGFASQRACDIACASFPWLLCLGFGLVFSALFTKTHRINMVMRHANACRRVKVTPLDVAKPMVMIIFTNVLVLGLWTGLSPLRYETVTASTDKFGRPTETYGVCSSDNEVAFIVALAVINLGALLFALYEAYSARNISTEYAESDYIFKAMTLIFLVCFMGIPILVIARENPAAYFFVFTGIIFVMCSSILLLIFVPKIMQSRKKKAVDVSESSISSGGSQGSKKEGIKILSTPKLQAELEEKIRKQGRELQKMKTMKDLLIDSKQDSRISVLTEGHDVYSEDDMERQASLASHRPSSVRFCTYITQDDGATKPEEKNTEAPDEE